MIKPEQDSKVETTLTAALEQKKKNHKNLHNTLQVTTKCNGRKYNSNKNNNGSASQGLGSLTGQPY